MNRFLIVLGLIFTVSLAAPQGFMLGLPDVPLEPIKESYMFVCDCWPCCDLPASPGRAPGGVPLGMSPWLQEQPLDAGLWNARSQEMLPDFLFANDFGAAGDKDIPIAIIDTGFSDVGWTTNYVSGYAIHDFSLAGWATNYHGRWMFDVMAQLTEPYYGFAPYYQYHLFSIGKDINYNLDEVAFCNALQAAYDLGAKVVITALGTFDAFDCVGHDVWNHMGMRTGDPIDILLFASAGNCVSNSQLVTCNDPTAIYPAAINRGGLIGVAAGVSGYENWSRNRDSRQEPLLRISGGPYHLKVYPEYIVNFGDGDWAIDLTCNWPNYVFEQPPNADGFSNCMVGTSHAAVAMAACAAQLIIDMGLTPAETKQFLLDDFAEDGRIDCALAITIPPQPPPDPPCE